ncbi:MAG: hypothetical protein IV112_14080 [Methyloversatilis discipulorum]|uniref:hypothetical protein n=1 Tax=Methyloversatilis discipulorum TaxID=1119528 RepID=UPI0026F1B26B|nr:hypothetical protein [Methyloversatilis discipulorum]MBT9517812.1 hypothetical protein [Methyloversatilis discipulorum]
MSANPIVYEDHSLSPLTGLSPLEACCLFYTYCRLKMPEALELQLRGLDADLSVRFFAQHPVLRREFVLVITVHRMVQSRHNADYLRYLIECLLEFNGCGGVELEATEAISVYRAGYLDVPGLIEFRNGGLFLDRRSEDVSSDEDAS